MVILECVKEPGSGTIRSYLSWNEATKTSGITHKSILYTYFTYTFMTHASKSEKIEKLILNMNRYDEKYFHRRKKYIKRIPFY